ncbi:hypothetical protein ACFQPA_21420 [Halomarina halobia]|uniref:DUF7344 domain-containing protein n=1 Tax=Halomarina halobia TaxID=3033386 RepID=A0ABD6AH62_9EURY|nr:hypothetical protein [Halomarina sp. PSR21]
MSQTRLQTPDEPSSPTDSADAGSEKLPLDTVFEILKNRRRRDILQYLWEHDGSANIGELAEHIAAMENGIEVNALSSAQRKRVYIGLYQCHLPKMDDAGIVDFDKHRGTIELREVAEQLTPYLTVQTDTTDRVPRSNLYVGLAVGVLVSGGALGAPVLGGIEPLVWTFLSTAALLFVTANQFRAKADGEEDSPLAPVLEHLDAEPSVS